MASPNGADFARQQVIRARLARLGSGFIPLRLPEAAEQSIPQRFEQQVRLYPNRVAVKAGAQALTYQALNQAANRLAHALLSQRGSKPEPVALLLEDIASTVAALLGVLKAGKFFVVLDPALPHARLAATLEDSQASLLVTDRHLQSVAAELVAPTGCQLLDLDHLEAHPCAGADPGLPLSPDTLAAIIYTSGSTGQPKGVLQTHRTLLHRFVVETNNFRFDPEDKLPMFQSLSTVAAMRNVLCALLNGAALLPFDPRKEGVAEITDWLLQEGVTHLHSTPSLFRRWADTLTGGEKFPALR
ncbi:MAG TPA: AMP-binding protein, partial [Dehalococcoidia bacterium]|nr:AMP-binding protein [Dehalococcoidia bacterium]